MSDPAGLERRVFWSRDALDDITAQIVFIAQDNPHAAMRVAALLRAAGDHLAVLPSGRKGRMAGTFEKVVRRSPYILAYAIGLDDAQRETVTILRVIHGSRNWQSGSWPNR